LQHAAAAAKAKAAHAMWKHAAQQPVSVLASWPLCTFAAVLDISVSLLLFVLPGWRR
jgi:cobalamin biosynthesis protein CobD/CbiB